MNTKLKLLGLGALVCASGSAYAQVVTDVLNETFDNSDNFTTSAGFFNDGGTDYFQIGSGTEKNYTGFSGGYLEGQDLDGEGADIPITVTWSGLSITGLSDLKFSGDFAEYFDSPGDIDDAGDFMLLEYQIDGGGFVSFLAFENDGTQYNTFFYEDTDFDGTGDGAALGNASSTFLKSLAGTGDTLDIRFSVSVDSGDEDFGVDNFIVTGVTAVPEPEFFGALAGVLVLGLAVVRRRRA